MSRQRALRDLGDRAAAAAPVERSSNAVADIIGQPLRQIRRGGYIPGLDAARAISILLVMVSHYGFGDIVPGGLGVTIFFFVSGFLITTLLASEFGRAGRIDVRSFYIRRLLRLGPELLVFIVISAVAGLAYVNTPDRWPLWADWVGALLYVTNYMKLFFLDQHGGGRWPHLWSLAVEEHYYLTFPLLVVALIGRMRLLIVAIAAICVAALLWRIGIWHADIRPEYAYEASDARIDSIAYGCLTALLLRSVPEQLTGRAGGALALATGLLLLVGSLLVRDPLFREAVRFTVQGLGLALIFGALFVWSGATPLLRAAETLPLRWMGRLSYAAYLWHFEAAIACRHVTGLAPSELKMADKVMLTVGGSGLAFALAFLSYQAVYLPFAGLRAQFGSHGLAPPGAEPRAERASVSHPAF